ncbi:MAG: hypothetical protein KKC68_07025 [Candidatus Thermoplasmatota archaeon]|nr:hypothetical protein [Candidatus Thermoplasmatota archaeon]MBU1941512.1 hypothetical protein [Candidatus Thermoplasmatota archaeon]
MPHNYAIINNEIQLLLAEKRTSLAVFRTAIAIFTLPLSVFTILIATSQYYNALESLYLILPLIIICVALSSFGVYLIMRSFQRIRKIDLKIENFKNQKIQKTN